MINRKSLYLLIFIVVTSCSKSKQESSLFPPNLYEKVDTHEVKLVEGYAVNPFTSNSISSIITEDGDTIRTGKWLEVKSHVQQSKEFNGPTKTDQKKDAIIYEVESRKGELSNKTEYQTFWYSDTSNSDDFVLKNMVGDTLETAVPQPIKGKKIDFIFSQPIVFGIPDYMNIGARDIQYISPDHGLLSESISALLADSKGNIWIGTDQGLFIYDGLYGRFFDNESGLRSKFIVDLLEDQHGNIWFSEYASGISCYNGSELIRFTEKEGLASKYNYKLHEDEKGNIWVGSGSALSCLQLSESYKTGTITHFSRKEGFDPGHIKFISESPNHQMWVSGVLNSNLFRLSIYDSPCILGGCDHQLNDNLELADHRKKISNQVKFLGAESEGKEVKLNYMRASVADQLGYVWISSQSGFFRYDTRSDQLLKYNKFNDTPGNSVVGIYEGDSSEIWLSTLKTGIIKIEDRSSKNEKYEWYDDLSGFYSTSTMSFAKDNSGNAWFGCYQGLNRLKPNSIKNLSDLNDFDRSPVRSFEQTSDGIIWYGTHNGLYRYQDGNFIQYKVEQGLANNYVWALEEDKIGGLWIGTLGGGLVYMKYDTANYKVSFTNYSKQNSGIIDNAVLKVYKDSKGDVWVGTYNGLCQLVRSGSEYEKNGEYVVNYLVGDALSNKGIYDIIEDSENNLWLATRGGGVSKMKRNQLGVPNEIIHFTTHEGFAGNSYTGIEFDQNGDLWCGSVDYGLNKILIKEGIPQKSIGISTPQGLSRNAVRGLKVISPNQVWVGTTAELNYIRLNSTKGEKKWQVFELGKQNGMREIRINPQAFYLDKDSILWFGTERLCQFVDVKNFNLSSKAPKVKMRSLGLNNNYLNYRILGDEISELITFEDVSDFNNYPINPKINYDLNHLTFYFSAIDFSAPHKIKFSYRLKNFNEEWSKPTTELKADYRNIPYGSYIFQISAIGESGEWSEPFEYHFTILPPWWHTWWARLLYGIGGLFLILAAMKWRTNKLEKRKKELEIEVDNATTEIREQKDEIEEAHMQLSEKNQEIMDSIAYAKRIQSAILPPDKMISSYLDDSFILYKPKDIVAGDFYWMHPTEKEVIFAAADCTGHGVPGAMVSVVCNHGLNRSVNEFKLNDPGRILDKTRELVIQEFEKSEDEVKDGMDIALVAMERTKDNNGNTIVKFAGAHNPLWIIRKGTDDLEQSTEEFEDIAKVKAIQGYTFIDVKADKQPIGKFEHAHPYTSHVLKLRKGDTFYIFSDGYADQFGGEKGKKLKSANFKKLLVSIQDKPMKEQRRLIDEAFEKWRGEHEQIDDVCVIGVRI